LVVVSTVATPGEWQCKIRTGGVRRLAVANGPSIFQMLFVYQVEDFGQGFGRHSGRRRRSVASSVKGDDVATNSSDDEQD